MKRIDWNEASRQGLVERINTEILHPLGLAMFRTPEDGASPGLLIAEDGKWEYALGTPGILPTVTAERDALQQLLNVTDQRVNDLQVELEAMRTDKARGERMLLAACVALGEVGEAMGADSEDDPSELVGLADELRRNAERYRFVSRLAWYVERAAQVYDLCNVNSNWRTERGSPDEDEVEAALDAAMAKEAEGCPLGEVEE